MNLIRIKVLSVALLGILSISSVRSQTFEGSGFDARIAPHYQMSSGDYYRGRTYVAYLVESGVIFVRFFSHADQVWSDPHPVVSGVAYIDAGNAHCVPDLQVIKSGPFRGHLILTWANARTKLFMIRSDLPENAESWPAKPTEIYAASGNNEPNKPCMIQLSDGTMVLFWNEKQNVTHSNWHKLFSFKSTDGGQSWSGSEILNFEFNDYVYAKPFAGAGDVIHLGIERQDQQSPFKSDIYYMKSTDKGRTWVRINGMPIGLPADHLALDEVLKPDQGQAARCHDVMEDASGRPVLGLVVSNTTTFADARFAYPQNGGWIVEPIGPSAILTVPRQFAGMCFDPLNASSAYVASNGTLIRYERTSGQWIAKDLVASSPLGEFYRPSRVNNANADVKILCGWSVEFHPLNGWGLSQLFAVPTHGRRPGMEFNIPPLRLASLPDTLVPEDLGKVFLRTLRSIFTDPDDQQLTIRVNGLDRRIETEISNDSLYLISVPDSTGTSSIGVSASDGNTVISDTFSIVISEINDPPAIINPIPDIVVGRNFGTVIVGNLTAVFKDVDNTRLNYQAGALSPGLQTRLTGSVLSMSSIADFSGMIPIRVAASDGIFTTADTFNVVVNSAPTVVASIPDTTVEEDFGRVFVGRLSACFYDEEGVELQFTVTADGDGIRSVITVDSLFLFSSNDFFGVIPVEVRASDGVRSSAFRFHCTVNPVNDPPVQVRDFEAIILEEDFGALELPELSGYFTDVEDVNLTYIVRILDEGLFADLHDKTLVLRSSDDFFGLVRVVVFAADEFSTCADTFLVEVLPIDDEPRLVASLPDISLNYNFGRVFVAHLPTFFFDDGPEPLTFAATPSWIGVSAEISNDSLYLDSEPDFAGELLVSVSAEGGVFTISDTFQVNIYVPLSITSKVVQNTQISKLAEVLVSADTTLQTTPTLCLYFDNDSNVSAMTQIEGSRVYRGEVEFKRSGYYTILSRAFSFQGVYSQSVQTFKVVMVRPSETSVVLSPDQRAELRVTPKANQEETYFTVLQTEEGSTAYEFGPARTYRSPLDVLIRYDFPGTGKTNAHESLRDPSKLFIHRWTSSGWQPIASRVYGDENLVRASTTALGKFTLMEVPDFQGSNLVPGRFSLEQNYPNPFNAGTTINYDLPEDSDLELAIFNILGHRVRILHHGFRFAGSHTAVWDGRNENGASVASGIYFYRLQTKTFVRVRKMMLVK